MDLRRFSMLRLAFMSSVSFLYLFMRSQSDDWYK